MCIIQASMWQVMIYKAFYGSTAVAFLVVTAFTALLLGLICSLFVVLLRWPISWLFQISSLQCTFGFILTASHTTLSGSQCLSSQAFFWNLCGTILNLITLAFFMHLKAAQCEWHQGLLPEGAVFRLPFLATALESLDCWVLWGTESLFWHYFGT